MSYPAIGPGRVTDEKIDTEGNYGDGQQIHAAGKFAKPMGQHERTMTAPGAGVNA
jgi:hypothetical protein